MTGYIYITPKDSKQEYQMHIDYHKGYGFILYVNGCVRDFTNPNYVSIKTEIYDKKNDCKTIVPATRNSKVKISKYMEILKNNAQEFINLYENNHISAFEYFKKQL